MLLNCGVGEDSWESLGLQGDLTSPFWFLWKEWCESWSSSILDTSCEELTHWKRLWCWERLGSGGEGDDRGSDGWMASRLQWTWVWVNSESWWWRPGMLWFMESQRVGHDWDWTELNWILSRFNTSLLFLVQVLTFASWLAYRFFRGQVRWSDIPNSLGIFHCFLSST